MKLNKLLERQVNKLIPESLRDNSGLKNFIYAVNESYCAYERDQELTTRAFKISEDEYIAVNEKLKTENNLKKISITRLKETIKEIGDTEIANDSEDLLDVIKYLKQQVIQRKETEAELLTTANRLTSLIINMQEGILVEDDKRKIVLTNHFFCDLFNITANPQYMTGADCSGSAAASKMLFKNPDAFENSIGKLVKEKKLVINEELELVNGRYFERDYIPIYTNGEYKGHLWKYRDITQRKNAQLAIEQSELTNRLIMNGALDAIITMDLNGCITFWNPQAEKIFGWQAAEVTGHLLSECIIPKQYREAHEKGMEYYRRTKQGPVLNKLIEITALHKNGTTFPVELSIIPVKGNGKEFFCSFIRDISQRKKAEEKIRASEELWQFALEGAGDGVWEYNFKTKEVFFSRQYKKMLGYNDDEFMNKPEEWLNRIHPEDVAIIDEVDNAYFKKLITSHQREYRIQHKDGNYRWILDRGMIINYDEQGMPQRIIGTHTDITQRKENEVELKRLALVARANKNGVLFTNADGTITWCNEGFCKITGYTTTEVLGKTPVELLQGALTDKENLAKMMDLFFKGKNFDVELTCYKKDTSTFWARSKGQAVFNKNGELLQYFAIVEDITNEKEAQLKIADFEQRFRMALEKIGDNVWEHDMITGITVFSNSAVSITGQKGVTDKDNADLWWGQVHPDDKHLLSITDESYKKGTIGHHTLEYRIINSDCTENWVLDRGVVIEKDKNNLPTKIVGTHTDITERKLAEQLLKVNEEKYRNIIANMNLGLLEVDNDEVVQYANQCFCNMSGFTAKELAGKKASTLFARGQNSEMLETKNEMRKKGISDAYEIALKNKRGELKWWLISGAPRFDDKGNLVGSIGIHLDITAQKELEIELLEAREAAEQSAKTKELFLANMSHEIRTPMNAIMGMANQLFKTELNGTQRFYLDTINKAADHLLVVINDILDISKIEAGKLTLEAIGFRPDEVIKHCITVMEHKAQEKGLRLIKEGCDGVCPVFIGDPHRLTQVLLNLISNAVKFTEKGYVLISGKFENATVGGQLMTISVTDTGIGMDESFQKSLFQKFTQEETITARKYGGTGLGMSISKQLVELMNGSIYVESKKGKGTTITITVPFAVGTTYDIPEEQRQLADTAVLKGKKILLVEDNEMNRLVATTVLAETGVEITEAENGLEAITLLKENVYDVILMDVQMPVMDGFEAAEKLRKQLKITTPVIALTANAIKGESDKCKAAGMNDFLSKPFKEDDLIQLLCRWVGNKPFVDTLQQPAVTGGSHKMLYDLTSLKKMSRGNTAFIHKMVNLFCTQMPVSVQEMKHAFANGDFEKLKSVAHKIKPALDNMGINVLHETIRNIEKNSVQNANKAAVEADVLFAAEIINEVLVQLQYSAEKMLLHNEAGNVL